MTRPQTASNGAVYLVDDDVAVQRGVGALLKAAEYDVVVFQSGDEFLSKVDGLTSENAAILVDVCMPGIQGLEMQEKLNERGFFFPVIVMTAHGDIQMAVRAMRNGAIDFLEKPFTVDEVVEALDRALREQDGKRRQTARKKTTVPPDLESRFATLTPRESEVLLEIVNGRTNKEIARILNLSPRTVEVHRQKVMLKMNANSIAELVRKAVLLNVGE